MDYDLTSLMIANLGDLSLMKITNGLPDQAGGLRYAFTLTTAPWITLPATGQINAKFSDRLAELTVFASCSRDLFDHIYTVLHNEQRITFGLSYEGDNFLLFGGEPRTETRKLHSFRLDSNREPVGEIEEILDLVGRP